MKDFLNKSPKILYYTDFHSYDTIKYYGAGTYPRNVDHFEKWLVT